ncbi:MAG: hypothetical protein HY909_08900 [Deltaproteobacteria bacterium]|nr:hypothetical protein [Deltaproteobacteria bacterium]
MRWWSLAAVLSLGCSSSRGDGGDNTPPGDERRPSEAARCSIEDLPGSLGGSGAGVVAVTRGPRRVLLLRWVGDGEDPSLPPRAQEVAWRWSDGEHAGAVYTSSSAEPFPRLAWTGAGFLLHHRAGLEWRDRTLEAPRPLRGLLPPGACLVRLTELAEGAVVTWLSRCDAVDGAEGHALFLGPNGEVRRRVQGLAESQGPARLSQLSARWDFGRVVLQGLNVTSGLPQWWLFDGEGERLADGHGELAACPRSGCVRVWASGENGAAVPEEAMLLKVDPLRGGHGFTTNIAARDVRAVAVSGDRVLALRSPAAGAGCDLAVVDVARRQVLADRHEEGLACSEGSVRPTARGFVVAVTGPQGPRLRALDCAR